MPRVELTRDEARSGDLPRVCMVCGQAAIFYRRTILRYTPWWVYLGIPLGVVPYVLLALAFNRRRLLLAPLCWLHHYHFLWRKAVSYGWLTTACLLFGGGALFLAYTVVLRDKKVSTDDMALLAFIILIAGSVLLVVWPVIALALKYAGIHAIGAAPHSVTLAPVPDEFVEALHIHRQDRRPNLDRAFCEG